MPKTAEGLQLLSTANITVLEPPALTFLFFILLLIKLCRATVERSMLPKYNASLGQPLHVAALQQQPVRCIHCLTCNEHVLQSITKSFFRIIPRLLHHVIGLRCQRSNELFRVLQESTLVPTLEQSHLRRIDLSFPSFLEQPTSCSEQY